jgi:hypothetical protein
MRFRIPIIVVTLSLAISCSDAQPSYRSDIPVVLHNICPFEGECDSLYLHQPCQSYAIEGDTSSYEAMLEAGAVRINYGNIHVQRPGLAIITKACDEFAIGDSVFILSRLGEGLYKVWHRGGLKDVEDILWEDSERFCMSAKLVSLLEATWWVDVTSGDGRTHWLCLTFEETRPNKRL